MLLALDRSLPCLPACLQLSRIGGLPEFVKEGITDLFGGGGYGNDARCNSGQSLSIPEFDIFADNESSGTKSWVSCEHGTAARLQCGVSTAPC